MSEACAPTFPVRWSKAPTFFLFWHIEGQGIGIAPNQVSLSLGNTLTIYRRDNWIILIIFPSGSRLSFETFLCKKIKQQTVTEYKSSIHAPVGGQLSAFSIIHHHISMHSLLKQSSDHSLNKTVQENNCLLSKFTANEFV